MLYRIDRMDTDGNKSYEYICGKRILGKRCYELIAHEKMEVLYIAKLVWSFKAFKVCFSHTISSHHNMTCK